MLPIERILAPTDFSDNAMRAVREAAELAAHFQAQLKVAHVIPPVPTVPPEMHYNFELPAYQEALQENARNRLEEVAVRLRRADPGAEAETVFCFGDPAREIVRIAAEWSADMIVIATHGHTGWQHLVFGSVAEKVVRTSRSPVLTIRLSEEGGPE
ncbi:MAG TPA: universal stress protein [Acidobacteriota bacterium]|nr:universal stress protein [Acidobacteriota bacterium]